MLGEQNDCQNVPQESLRPPENGTRVLAGQEGEVQLPVSVNMSVPQNLRA